MEVNKKQLADIFGASIRTIQNWQEQGMPVLRGGGKGNEVLYDSAAVIKWYAERDAEIENEKLRREVEELRQASETDLQPGTIEYERHRLTRAQADAQELKNARDSAEVVETAFCTFVLSRIAGEIASILDGIPLSVQRRLPARTAGRSSILNLATKRRRLASNGRRMTPPACFISASIMPASSASRSWTLLMPVISAKRPGSGPVMAFSGFRHPVKRLNRLTV